MTARIKGKLRRGIQGATGAAGTNGPVWRGEYNAATAYVLNDQVRNQLSTWICIAPTTGNAPPTLPGIENFWWSLVAQAGAIPLPNSALATMAEATIKGRAVGAGTGTPTDLTPAQARTVLDLAETVRRASTRSDLAALSGATFSTVYLTEAGRQGVFVWSSTNLSAQVTADPQQGLYVAPSTDVTGASGAWVRQYAGRADVRWWGAVCDGVTNDTAAIAAAFSAEVPLAISGVSALGTQVTITDKQVDIEGFGETTGFFCNGASTSGIRWTDTSTLLQDCRRVRFANMRFTTDRAGLHRALDIRWRPRPYSLDLSAGVFRDLKFETTDINAAYAWSDMVFCQNGNGLVFDNCSGSNRRDVETGKGIRLQTCLVTSVINPKFNYVDDAIYCEPTAFALVSFNAQTVNFTDGDIITSSGGAVGRLMRTVSDAGATGQIAIIPISGSFSVAQTITGALGGNGTITAVDASRWWAGETITVFGGDCVGVKNGINVFNPNSVYQKFVSVNATHFHANAKVAAINLEYATQAEFLGGLQYLLANNAIGVRLVGTDKVRLSTRVQDPAAHTGTVGIVVSVGVAGFGTNTSDEVFYDIDFDNIDTNESIDPAATNVVKPLYVRAGDGKFDEPLTAFAAANAFQRPLRVENSNGGSGTAALAFGVYAGGEGGALKAGVGLERGDANGRGDLFVYVNNTNDTAPFAAADKRWMFGRSGQLEAVGATGWLTLPSFTVAALPTAPAGSIAYANNARKNGEGAAAGTGSLVFRDATGWRMWDNVAGRFIAPIA